MRLFLILLLTVDAGAWLWTIGRARRGRSLAPIGEFAALHVLLLAAALALVPLFWMLTTSMKPPEEAGQFPPTFLPAALAQGAVGELLAQTARNYAAAWTAPPGPMTFARYFWVSILTAAGTTVGVLATSIPAAYALARLKFRGRGVAFALLLGVLMVPSQALLIPNYLTLERLGWLDGYPALIAPFLASAFGIFLLRQFFLTFPSELWEAAQLDGAGHGVFLWRIMTPLASPALATVAILTFLAQWDALMWPLAVTTRPQMRTLMVGLQSFSQEAVGEPQQLMAAAAFSMAPVLLAFFLLGRFFVQSVARTGLRG